MPNCYESNLVLEPLSSRRRAGWTTVILYFHGGAYVMGEGRPSDAQFSATMLTEQLNASILFPSYRLLSNQECAFAVALQDAISIQALVNVVCM